MCAARLANLERGDNQHTQICGTSQGSAAQLFNVSERSVSSARAVLDGGSPELVEEKKDPPPRFKRLSQKPEQGVSQKEKGNQVHRRDGRLHSTASRTSFHPAAGRPGPSDKPCSLKGGQLTRSESLTPRGGGGMTGPVVVWTVEVVELELEELVLEEVELVVEVVEELVVVETGGSKKLPTTAARAAASTAPDEAGRQKPPSEAFSAARRFAALSRGTASYTLQSSLQKAALRLTARPTLATYRIAVESLSNMLTEFTTATSLMLILVGIVPTTALSH
jgi:hypothetical protein